MNTQPPEPQTRVQRLARRAKRAVRHKNMDTLSTALQPVDNQHASDRVSILGPYKNRDKWRVLLVEGKERKSVCVPSREEALALIAKFKQETHRTKTQTIGTSLEDYRSYQINVRQVLPATAEQHYTSTASWLPISMLVGSLTPAKGLRLYEDLTQRISERTGKVLAVATHQFFLKVARQWGKWACKERLLPVNPFADVPLIGKQRKGKSQLRIDEAKQLTDTAQVLAEGGDSDMLAILLMLHLGLRQGEVGARIARDVDAQGSLLWITAGKTANAARRLKVPECLRAPLLALASRKQPGDLLFAEGTKRPRRQHFWSKLRTLCRRANVPLVCPHSLRGLHATLALDAGATSGMVAHALGHGSFKVTARHYATADSVQGSRAARVSEALGTNEDDVSRLLSGLSPAQLAELKNRLG